MSEFRPKYLFVLGRQPKLGLAELISLYGSHIRSSGNFALCDLTLDKIDFFRLGGSVKIAKILDRPDVRSWREISEYLIQRVPNEALKLPKGSLTLGVSLYGVNATVKSLNLTVLELKKLIKNSGRSVRVVPNRELWLNSGSVLHNKLTHKGNWEILVLKTDHGVLVAQNTFEQDINAYTLRDRHKPKRDPRVGMLPPKLAQILINLANPSMGAVILDPFCGTGTVLQEALLLGYKILGSDISQQMVDSTLQNLKWLDKKYDLKKESPNITVGDATIARWEGFDTVIAETYLGRPFTAAPGRGLAEKNSDDVNTILTKFLKNLAKQQKAGQRTVLAVPAFFPAGESHVSLKLIDRISEIGYNRTKFMGIQNADLIYRRAGQFVGRQILVLERK